MLEMFDSVSKKTQEPIRLIYIFKTFKDFQFIRNTSEAIKGYLTTS